MSNERAHYDMHPACLMLPKQSEQEYSALRSSIRSGWNPIHPIVLHDGKILDGRHRYRACCEEDVDPTFIAWDGSAFDWNPYRYVRVEHDARRNWTSEVQRVLCIEAIMAEEGGFDEARQRVADAANAARAEAARGNQNAARKPVVEENSGGHNVTTTVSSIVPSESRHRTREAHAAIAGTGAGAVKTANKMKRLAAALDRPDVVRGVRDGTMNAHAAMKSLEEAAKAESLARAVTIDLPEGIHHGDFRKLAASIPDESVELVFTDPPYDKDSVELYEAAAREAARILKPGGSMIAYSGQRFLPDVLVGMSRHLRYWWTIAGVHDGGNQMLQKLGIRCGWKPLVWFVKDTRGDVQNVILDVVRGDREKDAHKWQQAQSEAEYYVSELCSENGVVVDFFLGGGTTAAACRATGRRFIGFDTDAGAITKSVERLAA